MARLGGHPLAQDPRWVRVDGGRSDGRVTGYECFLPVVGARFGRLLVGQLEGRGKLARVACRCDCGGRWEGEPRALRRGRVQCAGCGYAKSGKARAKWTDLFPDRAVRSAWLHRYTGIVSRCYDPNHRAYPNYGGRGIKLYGPWKRDRRKFFEYVVASFPNYAQLGLDLDRIDNDRGYEPGNLRLTSRSENCANKRNTTTLECAGETLTFSEFWSRYCPEWHRNAIQHHFDRGRSPEWVVAHYRATRGGMGPAELWAESPFRRAYLGGAGDRP